MQQQCTHMLHIRIHTQRMWITLNMGCHSCEVIMTWKRAQLIEVRHSNQNALTYVHIGGVNGMNFFIACARMHTFCRHWHEFYMSRTLKISHAVRIYFYTAYTAHVCYVYILKCQYAWHSHLDLHLYMFCEDAVTQLYGFLGLHIKKSVCSHCTRLHTLGSERKSTLFPSIIEDGSEGDFATYFCPLLHTPAICKEFRGWGGQQCPPWGHPEDSHWSRSQDRAPSPQR